MNDFVQTRIKIEYPEKNYLLCAAGRLNIHMETTTPLRPKSPRSRSVSSAIDNPKPSKQKKRTTSETQTQKKAHGNAKTHQ